MAVLDFHHPDFRTQLDAYIQEHYDPGSIEETLEAGSPGPVFSSIDKDYSIMGKYSFSMPAVGRKEKSTLEDLSKYLTRQSGTFQQQLFALIDKRGEKDADVYNRADIDRRLFSKIRSRRDYVPKKSTVLALAMALECNMDEATDLLNSAGYAFMPSSKRDLIVQFCIEKGQFNLMEINTLLLAYDQPLLGGKNE